jgi:dUTP pyrophosphatase
MTSEEAGGELVIGAALSRNALQAALRASPPLVAGLSDPAVQVQPNGIDLTLASLARQVGPGQIGVDNAERLLPQTIPLAPEDGWFTLPPGLYLGTLQEQVNLPPDLLALGRPRSSLLRSGVAVHTAVWDAGYSGRSQVLIQVMNPDGFRVAVGARVVQLVFFRLTEAVADGYRGAYQHENAG